MMFGVEKGSISKLSNMNYIKEVKCIGNVPAKDHFSVAFGVNENYFPPLGILLTSLVENNCQKQIDVYVGTTDVSTEQEQRLRTLVEKYSNLSVNIYCIDSGRLGDYVGRNYPTAAYYRVIMADALYPQVEKLLYMDVDTIFMGDVGTFLDIDFSDKIFCAVEDTLSGKSLRDHKQELNLNEDDKYFNSGVMYIDLAKWHEHNISKQVITLLHERAIGKRKFAFMDQGAINMVAAGLWKPIPMKFNLMVPVLRERLGGVLPNDTVILHFAGLYKPWAGRTEHERQELNDNCVEMVLFEKYRDKSIWSDYKGYKKRYRTLRLISRWMFSRGKMLLGIKWYIKYMIAKIEGDK